MHKKPDSSAHVTGKSEMEKSVRVCVFWPANVISVLLGNDITFLLLNISEVALSASLIPVHRSLADTAVISNSQIVLTQSQRLAICSLGVPPSTNSSSGKFCKFKGFVSCQSVEKRLERRCTS